MSKKVREVVRLREARRMLGVGKTTFWKLTRDGELPRPFILPGSNVRVVELAALEDYLTKARDEAKNAA